MKIEYVPENAKPENYRQQASKQILSAEESFERCDTDGFLSQWASGINARINDAKAELLEAGRQAEFTFLADLDGNLVKAKPVRTKFGTKWLTRVGGELKWLAYKPAKVTTLSKHGFQEVQVTRRAVVATESYDYNVSVFFYPEEWIGLEI